MAQTTPTASSLSKALRLSRGNPSRTAPALHTPRAGNSRPLLRSEVAAVSLAVLTISPSGSFVSEVIVGSWVGTPVITSGNAYSCADRMGGRPPPRSPRWILARPRRRSPEAPRRSMILIDTSVWEVLVLIEHRGLGGRGIDWVNADLLASVLRIGIQNSTRDARLIAVAAKFGLAAVSSRPRVDRERTVPLDLPTATRQLRLGSHQKGTTPSSTGFPLVRPRGFEPLAF